MSDTPKFRVVAIRPDGTHVVISYGNDRDLAEKIVDLLNHGPQYRQVFIEPDRDPASSGEP